MKQPKRITRSQKELMIKAKMVPDEWMARYEDADYLHIINKKTHEIQIIDKNVISKIQKR